jgi:hypothetical protein
LEELLPEAELSLDVLVWGELVESEDLLESADVLLSPELEAVDPDPPLRA